MKFLVGSIIGKYSIISSHILTFTVVVAMFLLCLTRPILPDEITTGSFKADVINRYSSTRTSWRRGGLKRAPRSHLDQLIQRTFLSTCAGTIFVSLPAI